METDNNAKSTNAEQPASLIRIGLEKDEIVIRCKVKDLVFITENDPNSKYVVMDEKQFAKEVVFNLQNLEPRVEAGTNMIEDAFEKAYNEVYVSGGDCMIDKDNPIT